jgi:hypothetical protein
MYDIAAGMARLEQGQKAHDEKLDVFQHRLFGNGQPGELTKIEDRLTVLEKFRYILMGVGLVFSIIGGMAGAIIEVFASNIK